MIRITVTIVEAITCLALVYGPIVAAEESSSVEYSFGDSVPLSEEDLRDITGQVLARNPLLSSSPGIKYAGAQRSVRSIDIANIIYYPHAESAGSKQAFQVQCRRQIPIESWTCGDAKIRLYLQLETQDFELRVTGGIGSEEALALISATRDALQADAKDRSNTPQTAVMIIPYYDSYLVTWGSSEGYQELIMQARLSEGGDPANPNDWQVNIYVPPNQ